jgi:hypothetical protein
MAGGDPLFPKAAGSYIFTSVTGSRGGAMKKANIDELKLSDVRPGVTVSGHGLRRDDYYAIDEGDPGA